MKLHEYQSKDLLSRFGVPVPEGDVTSDYSEAKAIAEACAKLDGAHAEGYRKRAERQAQDIVELQKKLKSARGVVPVSAPDDLANRLASLYGLPAS